MNMDNEQAQVAVQALAASAVDAGVGAGESMASLLEKMSSEVAEGALEVAGEGAGLVLEGVDLETPSDADLAICGNSEGPEAGVSVPEGEESEGDGRKSKNFRGRWAHLSEQERRVVELTTKRGLTLGEAYRAVFGDAGGGVLGADLPLPGGLGGQVPSGFQPSGEAGSEVVVLDRQISEQKERVDALKRAKGAAGGDMGAYDAASEAYLEARERLRELQASRQTAVGEEAARLMEVRRRSAVLSEAAVGEEFPEALVPGTELYEAVHEELGYLKESKSPLLNDPYVQYKVARRMARTLGYRPTRAGAAVVNQGGGSRPIAAGPMAVRSVRPVPVRSVTMEDPATSIERRVASASSSSAMLELMRELGTPVERLLKG